MGPKESGAAQVVAYIQRKGAKPTAEKVAEAAETIKALADELAVIWAEAAAAMVRAREMEKAIRWAEVANRPLAARYHRTKKKRIRKKYAKRILAWYREEVL